MNGGDLTVNITADYAGFTKAMGEVQKQATFGGNKASKSFGDEFKFQLSKNFGDQKIGNMIGQAMSLGAADRFMRAFADGIREDKGVGEIIEGFFTGLPIVGAAYDLGKSMGENLTGGLLDYLNDNAVATAEEVAQAQAKMRQYEQEEAAAKKAYDLKVANAEKIAQQEARIDSDARNEARNLEESLLRETAKMNAEAARMSGDERLAAEIETNEELRRLERQRIEAYGATGPNKEAFDAAKAVFDKREEFARESLRRRLKEIDDQEGAEIEAADAVRQERDRMIYEMEEKQREAMIEAAEKANGEIASIEQERMRAGSAGISSANTALGQFTFDAYPDTEKRRNDQRLIKATELIAAKASVGGFS